LKVGRQGLSGDNLGSRDLDVHVGRERRVEAVSTPPAHHRGPYDLV
jgi:hypothetical protein